MSNLEGTAIQVASLGSMLHGTPIQQILVILDTCYAGRGVADFGSVAQDHINSLRSNDQFARGFYAMAAARPKEEARQCFAQVLVDTLEDPPLSCGGDQQQYLYAYEILIETINQKFQTLRLKQRARLDAFNVQSAALFFRNLRYRTVPAGLDLQTQRRLTYIEHWGPRSRGTEIEAQPGWYFTGRTVVLTELVTWLTSPACDGKARVITAGPGSGKSAVLARIVTLSDPEYRRRVPLADVPPESIPREGLVDVAIHARQKTLRDCLDEIASQTGVSATSPEVLVDGLARGGCTRVIVLDALDEAIEPHEIARRLLRPLTLVASVRLIVGTRRETLEGLRGDLLAALGPAVVTLDLDDPKYIQPADLAEYVRRRLLAQDDPTRTSPYRDRPELASQIAHAVGEKAYPVFLIARLISQALLEAAGPIDVTRPDWKAFPTTVAAAFDEYLDRFGANKERVVDLFRPLAYAEGAGLPFENLWAPLTSALSEKIYRAGDVEWLMEHAGAFLVEATEDDRSVYRLYHQALIDHMRFPKRPLSEVQREFTETLIRQTPDRRDGGGKDWLQASPYVRQHLASHAAAAGMLGDLTTDALYLATAEPRRLLRAMDVSGGHLDAETSHVYQGASHNLLTASFAERASYLEMAARQNGLNSLADRFSRLPLPLPFSVRWARWQPSATHRVIARTDGSIKALAVGERAGRAVIVSGGFDDTVQAWDLELGVAVGEPLRGHEDWVSALALGKRAGRAVIVSGGGRGGTVRVWDLESGAAVGEPLRGHDGEVSALALGKRSGRAVIVSGGKDGTVRVWDLESGVAVGKPLRGHDGGVSALALGERAGRAVIVSGGDDGTVRVWDLESGVAVGEPLEGYRSWVNVLAVREWTGRAVIVSGGLDGKVQMWDLESSATVGEPLRGHDGGVSALEGSGWAAR